MMQEIRISEVVIIRIWTSLSASTWKNLAATPDWVRMPMPETDRRVMSLLMVILISGYSSPRAFTMSLTISRSRSRTIKETSKAFLTGAVWVMISTLTSASDSSLRQRVRIMELTGTFFSEIMRFLWSTVRPSTLWLSI
ncbi:hypothetical protein SDC9_186618 [bioreactor metagenome]|uniref:Uncharacterized protein n=1 Tax=bioreactor metagenome TaxID=1076179 RepID=A0A645HL04_9ZZZZ